MTLSDATQNISDAINAISFTNIIIISVAVIWIIFSIAFTYHWISYSRNPLVTIIALGIYFFISLALLGFALLSFEYA